MMQATHQVPVDELISSPARRFDFLADFVGFGANDNAIILQALTILVASLLLKRTLYVLFVLVAIGNAIWLVYGEITRRLAFNAPEAQAGMLLTVPVMFVACAVVARALTENLRNSLVRARLRAESLERAEA